MHLFHSHGDPRDYHLPQGLLFRRTVLRLPLRVVFSRSAAAASLKFRDSCGWRAKALAAKLVRLPVRPFPSLAPQVVGYGSTDSALFYRCYQLTVARCLGRASRCCLMYQCLRLTLDSLRPWNSGASVASVFAHRGAPQFQHLSTTSFQLECLSNMRHACQHTTSWSRDMGLVGQFTCGQDVGSS